MEGAWHLLCCCRRAPRKLNLQLVPRGPDQPARVPGGIPARRTLFSVRVLLQGEA